MRRSGASCCHQVGATRSAGSAAHPPSYRRACLRRGPPADRSCGPAVERALMAQSSEVVGATDNAATAVRCKKMIIIEMPPAPAAAAPASIMQSTHASQPACCMPAICHARIGLFPQGVGFSGLYSAFLRLAGWLAEKSYRKLLLLLMPRAGSPAVHHSTRQPEKWSCAVACMLHACPLAPGPAAGGPPSTAVLSNTAVLARCPDQPGRTSVAAPHGCQPPRAQGVATQGAGGQGERRGAAPDSR